MLTISIIIVVIEKHDAHLVSQYHNLNRKDKTKKMPLCDVTGASVPRSSPYRFNSIVILLLLLSSVHFLEKTSHNGR